MNMNWYKVFMKILLVTKSFSKAKNLGRSCKVHFLLASFKGHKPFVRDIHIQASKWGHHFRRRVTCPVTLLHGECDPAYPVKTVEALVKTKRNFRLITLEKTGQLAYYQHPKISFAILDEQFTARELSAIAV